MISTRTLVTSCALLLAGALSAAPQQHPTSKPDPAPAKPMTWHGVLDEASFRALHQLKAEKAPPLHGTDVEVGGAKCYLSLPYGTPRGGVLVIHEWWGLNQHVKHWADRLAADGYAALAVDLYGGKVATTREDASAAMRSVDEQKALAVLQAGHEFLAKDPRVKARKRACIGWCFGGGWSLRLALAARDLDAAVIYYGRLVDDPEQLAAIRAPVLGVFGNQDRGIPKEAVDRFAGAMKKAGKPLELHRYDAPHAFANPSAAAYHAGPAADAWHHVRVFLRQKLTPAPTGLLAKREVKLRFDVPKGWVAESAHGMRAATVKAAEHTVCTVVALPGEAGGVAANINRWRQQMGQAELTDKELAALPHLVVLRHSAPMVRIDGTYRGMGGDEVRGAVMLAVVCTLPGETVFVKMVGPKAEVEAQLGKFQAFSESLDVH